MPQWNAENPFEMIKFRGKEQKYFVVDFGYPRFGEIDGYNVMWNGHYINYFETSRFYYSKYMNLTTKVIEDYGFQVPIYSYNVQMRNPTLQNDRIRVGVRPVSFRKGMLDLFHILLDDKEIKAVGNIIHAVIDKDTRTIPFPVPDVVNEIVGKFFAPFAEEVDTDPRGATKAEESWS